MPGGSAKVGVKILIHDIRGRLVKRLLDQEKEPGTYQVAWDGRDDKEERVGSGVYFCTTTAGDFSSSRKMAVIK